METATSIQLLEEQIRIIWLFLQRPIVQRQLIAVLITVLVGWLIANSLQWFVRQRLHWHDDDWYRPQRWLVATQALYDPIVILLALRGLLWWFEQQQWPFGLITRSSTVFFLWVLYRIAVTIINARLPRRRVRYYKIYLLRPLLFLLVIILVGDGLINLPLLGQIEIFTLFDQPLRLGNVIYALLALYFFIALSRLVQDTIRWRYEARDNVDADFLSSILKTGRNLTIGLGLLVAGSSLGFSFASLALIGGGLSVGIGLGLQKVAANFISGVLIWSDESVRLGDVIKVNNEMGQVEKIGVRSTLVRTVDNVEMIVPNETFLTSTVTTFTKSSRRIRISISIGVSYDSDPAFVRELLLKTAAKHNLVQKQPAPLVFFKQFGPSSLDFQLLLWVDDPLKVGSVSSDLHFMIWKALQENNIEIPFPQSDINLGTGWDKLNFSAGTDR